MLQSSGHRHFELEQSAEFRHVKYEGFPGQEGDDDVFLELLEVEERGGGRGGGGRAEGHGGRLLLPGHVEREGGVGVENVAVSTAEELHQFVHSMQPVGKFGRVSHSCIPATEVPQPLVCFRLPNW